jgi:hypothetical protein
MSQPDGGRQRRTKRWLFLSLALATLVLVAACSGPDSGDDRDPTPTPTHTPTPTVTPTPSPTATPTIPPTATPEPTATLEATATATTAASSDASPTTSAAASPTSATGTLLDGLPTVEELPAIYEIAAEGSRTAQELANAYADKSAHLQRLDEWGFKNHVYREFQRPSAGPDDPLPNYLLATINEYGSPEQADAALEWLTSTDRALGAQEPAAPEIGDNRAATTVPTSTGIPTAKIYVRKGALLYVYYAEGGQPLDAIAQVATTVFQRQ